jgi:formylglycine-generating enzyme required for sulfatase activity
LPQSWVNGSEKRGLKVSRVTGIHVIGLLALVTVIGCVNANPPVLTEAQEIERTKRHVEGDTFQDCAACPKMIVVSSGEFLMGSEPTESRRDDDEGPVRRVEIEKAFAVGVYEVTFDEWLQCVNDSGCNDYVPNEVDWGKGRHPVFDVSWSDAKAYVTWLSMKTGGSYRLLTESEWEYISRAGTTTPYWWGDKLKQGVAVCDGCNRALGNNLKTMPVGSFPANPFGLYDTQGNVWEWVEDCWSENYNEHAPSSASWVPDDKCKRRVLRGGSWSTGANQLRSANRSWKGPTYRGPKDHGKGFRVAMTLSEK